jgi:molybdopterin converting factor small subunit
VQVTVTFLGIIRDQVGSRSLDFELPSGAPLRDLFDALAPQLEDRLADWAWDREKRMFTEKVMVSRNLVPGGRDEAMILADGDEILVFPPIAGG